MTLGHDPGESTRPVVVGVDGSESSLTALRWGHYLSSISGSVLTVVTVWEPTTAFGLMGEGWGALPTDWDPVSDAAQALETTLDQVFGPARPAGVETRVEQGNTAQVLLEASLDAQVLVVGSRGHGGFASLLLGSVGAACAEHATCPVLVVHGTTPPPVRPEPTSSPARTEPTP